MKLSEFLAAARDAAKKEGSKHLPLGYEWLEHKAEMAVQLEHANRRLRTKLRHHGKILIEDAEWEDEQDDTG